MVSAADKPGGDAEYTVVARRYRPKTFAELIGQDHISHALGHAIETGRVGHAYLFTGARGVGKTSTARIFAKVLNTPEGSDPSLVAEISQAIDSGDDIDVIEIDGASNRGIEEIRQLRANVNVRPSRSPYKVYIIDEVHMLTNQAFNALLKTLEEPPAHVKFIFCTTDPDKIPITVLSRCQRFDFAPVKLDAIQQRLQEICSGEGFEADDEALALLARRAAGSMRDSQSLLEQVMSFSSERITVEQVHALLGTADESRLRALLESLIDQQPLEAIRQVDEAIQAGSDAGQLAEQLLSFLRDVMAVGVGGGPELLKVANPSGWESLQELAQRWGVQTVLSAIQILDESLVRMRTSIASVTLLEVALVQICQLEQLASITALLERVSQPQLTGRKPVEKKKSAMNLAAESPPRPPVPGSDAANSTPHSLPHSQPPTASTSQAASAQATGTQAANAKATPSPPREVAAEGLESAGGGKPPEQAIEPVSESSSGRPASIDAPASANQAAEAASGAGMGSPEALQAWQSALRSLDGMLADFAGLAIAVEPASSSQWTVVFGQGATATREYCEQADRKSALQNLLKTQLGREIQLRFRVVPGTPAKAAAPVPQSTQRAQRLREVSDDPYVKQLCEVIDGEILRVDPPRNNGGQPAQPRGQPSSGRG